jgi:hypothetical protein
MTRFPRFVAARFPCHSAKKDQGSGRFYAPKGLRQRRVLLFVQFPVQLSQLVRQQFQDKALPLGKLEALALLSGSFAPSFSAATVHDDNSTPERRRPTSRLKSSRSLVASSSGIEAASFSKVCQEAFLRLLIKQLYVFKTYCQEQVYSFGVEYGYAQAAKKRTSTHLPRRRQHREEYYPLP